MGRAQGPDLFITDQQFMVSLVTAGLVSEQYPEVQEEPEPLVLFMGYGDISIDFRMEVWVNDPMLMLGVMSDLRYKIWEAFAEHNIEIPFPQRDLHLRSGIPWEQLGAQLHKAPIEPESKGAESQSNESVYSQAAVTRQA